MYISIHFYIFSRKSHFSFSAGLAAPVGWDASGAERCTDGEYSEPKGGRVHLCGLDLQKIPSKRDMQIILDFCC